MKSVFHILVVAASVAALPLLSAQAQTTRKPGSRPATKPASKPTSRPTPAPPSRPTAQPAPAAEPSLLESMIPNTFTGGPFEVGTRAVNLGIGVGSRYDYGTNLRAGTSSVSPAISLSYEQGLLAAGPGVVAAGVFAGYRRATYNLNGSGTWKYADFIMTVRGAFHYPVLPELDAYAGVGVGVRHNSANYEGSTASPNEGNKTELASGLFVGARYFLLQNIGAFAELGYDQSYLKIGLTAKF